MAASILIAVSGMQPVAHAVGDGEEFLALADVERTLSSAASNSITSVTRPGRGDITMMRVER